MNKALDFLLRYYIIYHHVFKYRYNMYKKPEKLYSAPSIRSYQANSSLFVKTKLKISVLQGNGVFFHVQLQQRTNIELTEFLTVEDSLQLVEAKRRSRFIAALGSLNNF
jgi:hypothetical protein